MERPIRWYDARTFLSTLSPTSLNPFQELLIADGQVLDSGDVVVGVEAVTVAGEVG